MPLPATPQPTPVEPTGAAEGEVTPTVQPATGTAPAEAAGRPETPQEKVERLIRSAEVERDAEIDAVPSDPASPVFRVRGPDGEQEVTLDELLKGYSRQSDYTRKTQELAAQRKSLEAERKALMESDAAKALRALAEKDPGALDPLDPDSVMAHLRRQVAEQLTALYAPVEEAYAAETAKAKVEAFISSKPEFQDPSFKQSVAALLKEDANLSLQMAYEVALGRKLAAERTTLQTEAQRHRKLLAEAGLQASAGTSGREAPGQVPAHVRKQGAWAIAQHLARAKGSW